MQRRRRRYPLTAPAVRPLTIWRWKTMTRRKSGAVIETAAAIASDLISGGGLAIEVADDRRDHGLVLRIQKEGLSPESRCMREGKLKRPVVITPGHITGMITRRNASKWEQPSTRAASSSSVGMFWKNERSIQMVKGWLIADQNGDHRPGLTVEGGRCIAEERAENFGRVDEGRQVARDQDGVRQGAEDERCYQEPKCEVSIRSVPGRSRRACRR